MHFDAFDREDRRMLLRNPMVDGRRFTEAELDRIVGDIRPENSYRKTDYDPGMFMHRTGEAVERSMGLCHDPVRLKGELGTNLGELLMVMRSGGADKTAENGSDVIASPHRHRAGGSPLPPTEGRRSSDPSR